MAAPSMIKTFDLVDDPTTNEIVCWSPGGESFIVRNKAAFEDRVLGQYFRHQSIRSFTNLLTSYEFKRASLTQWEYAHPSFKRGQKELLVNIRHRRPSHRSSLHLQNQTLDNSVAPSNQLAAASLSQLNIWEELKMIRVEVNKIGARLDSILLHNPDIMTGQNAQGFGAGSAQEENRREDQMAFDGVASTVVGGGIDGSVEVILQEMGGEEGGFGDPLASGWLDMLGAGSGAASAQENRRDDQMALDVVAPTVVGAGIDGSVEAILQEMGGEEGGFGDPRASGRLDNPENEANNNFVNHS